MRRTSAGSPLQDRRPGRFVGHIIDAVQAWIGQIDQPFDRFRHLILSPPGVNYAATLCPTMWSVRQIQTKFRPGGTPGILARHLKAFLLLANPNGVDLSREIPDLFF